MSAVGLQNFSYPTQLQSPYSGSYDENNINKITSSASGSANLPYTNNPDAVQNVANVDNQASQTEDSTTLSPDALKLLQSLSSGGAKNSDALLQILGSSADNSNPVSALLGSTNNGSNTVSELLGGNGSGDLVSEILGGALSSEPLAQAIISQSSAKLQQQSNQLSESFKSAEKNSIDPVQKALQSYQNAINAANNNSSTQSGSSINEIA